MSRTEVQLSDAEMTHAIEVGRSRYRVQRQGGRFDGRVTPTADGETIDIQGAVAELALANYLGSGWAGALDLREWFTARTEAGLVGGVRVRSTNYPNGRLVLHAHDPDDVPHVLVNTHRAPIVELVGWAFPWEVRTPSWWRADIARPCYLIPEQLLRQADPNDLISAIPPPPPTPATNTDWSWLPDHGTPLTEAAQRYVEHFFWVAPLRDLQFSNPLRLPTLQGKPGCTCEEGTTCAALGCHPVWTEFPGCKPERVMTVWRHRPKTRIGLRTGGISRLLCVRVEDPTALSADLPVTLVHEDTKTRTHFFDVPHGLWLPRGRRLNADVEILCEGGTVAVTPSTQPSGQVSRWHHAPIASTPEWLLEALRA